MTGKEMYDVLPNEILGIGPETLNKELHQFYEDRKKELKKRIEERQDNA